MTLGVNALLTSLRRRVWASFPLLRVSGDLVSRPYVEITRRMVADFGGDIGDLEPTADGFLIRSIPAYRGRSYRIEPDASSASYPFALAAASGGHITVPGLGRGASTRPLRSMPREKPCWRGPKARAGTRAALSPGRSSTSRASLLGRKDGWKEVSRPGAWSP